MHKVIIADKDEHGGQIRELFWEYLQWANAKVNDEFGVNFDIAAMLETDMNNLDKFMPPSGRLLLSYEDEHLTGIACLKFLMPRVGEIKRMYVRPQHRKSGFGRALVNRVLEEAVQTGYEWVRLDSARFMGEAHRLYHAVGFREIEA